ncbi:MAG: tetratricopeptide repeat protein [Promethearchaeota archaeon]|nr:MAG: tetratricopeptide repeat protein [Candidatus Lokiarchaeota archaeon]
MKLREDKGREMKGKIDNWIKKGRIYYNNGQYEAALEMFKEVLKIDPNNIAVLNKVGNIYFALNNLSESLSIYNNLRSIFKRLGLLEREREVLEKIGRIYTIQGKYSGAINIYLEALELYDKIEDGSAKPDEGKFLLLYTIGDLYKRQKSYAKALSSFTLLLQLHSEFGPLEGIADDLSEIGSILCKQRSFSDGLKKFEEALQIYKAERIVSKTAISLFEIGKIYYKLNQYLKALPYLDEAFNYFKELGLLTPDEYYYRNIKKMLEDSKKG